MCTQARLVQGGRESEWFGMPMAGAPAPQANVRLASDQPAYLEVTFDPAAHGEAGLGSVRRGVMLATNTGQQLTFNFSAQVSR